VYDLTDIALARSWRGATERAKVAAVALSGMRVSLLEARSLERAPNAAPSLRRPL
jgi:hypothetical protein